MSAAGPAQRDDLFTMRAMSHRALPRRTAPVAGARAATADLELEDYDALFARRTIYTGERYGEPLFGLVHRIRRSTTHQNRRFAKKTGCELLQSERH